MGFHAFRRFRPAWLRKSGAPRDLERLWMGRAAEEVGDLYSTLRDDVTFRQEWAQPWVWTSNWSTMIHKTKRRLKRRTLRNQMKCAVGSSLYKTFRRHGLHLRAGLVQHGGVHAMEGTVYRGRTHAIRIAAQRRGDYGLVVPRVRNFPGYRIQNL